MSLPDNSQFARMIKYFTFNKNGHPIRIIVNYNAQFALKIFRYSIYLEYKTLHIINFDLIEILSFEMQNQVCLRKSGKKFLREIQEKPHHYELDRFRS